MQSTSGIAGYRPAMKHTVDILNGNSHSHTSFLNKITNCLDFILAVVLAKVGCKWQSVFQGNAINNFMWWIVVCYFN